MEIRLVREDDLLPLALLYSESFTEADPEKPWTVERAHDLISHYYKLQPDLFFVAEEGSALVGMIVVKIKPWRQGNRCTEGEFFVRVDKQGEGIGKKLFIKVLEEALDKYQAESLESITFAEKEFPLSWYKSIGLRPDAHAMFIKGDTLEMLKNLKSKL